MSIRFGTEGWRAVMAEEFTADNVRVVTQAIAEHILAKIKTSTKASRTKLMLPKVSLASPTRSLRTVVVGYDTRFLSNYFARAVCEVLAGNGLPSILSDRPVPTCTVSRYVVAHQFPLGIMVTASHNPGIYNGIKVKEAYGGSATTETVASIEHRLGQSPVQSEPFDCSAGVFVIQQANMMPVYLQGIRSFVDLPAIRRSRFRVIVDSMYGAGGSLIERLLSGGTCRVHTLHSQPDPLFGGQAPEPIASHLAELMQTVKRQRADLGIANDGDADRVGIIGPGGRWLNPGQVMCVLLLHAVKNRQMKGAVVKTVSNTMMINRVAEALGLRLFEVPVGFKHIAKLMLEQDVLIGGEESGGIGIKGYLPERDGILNGLLVLEAMAAERQSLATILQRLERQFGQWHYGRQDLHLTQDQVDALFNRLRTAPPEQIAKIPVSNVNTLDGVKLVGRDESWLLFRRSGTEPIVRIYAETPRKSRLAPLLAFGVRLARTPA